MLEMNVVRGVGGVCDMCMCLAQAVWGGEGRVDEILFGLYQSCWDRGSVGHVSVFSCGGVGRGLDQGP